MPKVKPHRTSPSLDMTPMVDLAFLLVTFFMLTTQFRPDEAVVVDPPSSTSDFMAPDSDILTLTIDDKKRVFFGYDKAPVKEAAIKAVAAKYGVSFTPTQIKQFSLMPNFGVPIGQLGSYLDKNTEERKALNPKLPGVPYDSLNNQVIDWVLEARKANAAIFKKPTFLVIKGDGNADVKTVQTVIKILQEKDINRFNLQTSLEMKPTSVQ
ncbi:biopolymer transporter ExbD [Hymenobacter sp. UV11]|uniref:ExbD/TolR family protein n=1 Tax=Hymenobacter sp. UV11 TaxID=1849735 RepID=UPI00105EBEDB|nr:biopolymer transporter ExbD [Hymenobacter sp. UV11]TDN38935.1 biopolymer transporter ExbD [Hymenobacter sp. UV11]TFZ65983.1 biopolymer transporter ExbD [Hymenobacter sp. UV11]